MSDMLNYSVSVEVSVEKGVTKLEVEDIIREALNRADPIIGYDYVEATEID